jgi:plastocyanin
MSKQSRRFLPADKPQGGFMEKDNKSERAAWRKRFSATLTCVLLVSVPLAVRAAEADAQQVTVHLGDYRFQPDTIEVVAGRPVELMLVNDDKITPHNFTLKEPDAGLDLSADVSGDQSSTLRFTPQTAGTYPLYCNKKLPFMKSHRERGMEARLVVKPAS